MFDVINKTKGKAPNLPFCDIKNCVVGKNYELSCVFIGDMRSKIFNKKYRNIDKPTNILSFSFDKNSGEIFINLNRAKQEASHFNKNTKNFIGFLFIHGLLHLKGFSHSSTMEQREKILCKKFNIY